MIANAYNFNHLDDGTFFCFLNLVVKGEWHYTLDLQTLFNLGTILWTALDYGLQEFEEKQLSPELDALIDIMTSAGGKFCFKTITIRNLALSLRTWFFVVVQHLEDAAKGIKKKQVVPFMCVSVSLLSDIKADNGSWNRFSIDIVRCGNREQIHVILNFFFSSSRPAPASFIFRRISSYCCVPLMWPKISIPHSFNKTVHESSATSVSISVRNDRYLFSL